MVAFVQWLSVLPNAELCSVVLSVPSTHTSDAERVCPSSQLQFCISCSRVIYINLQCVAQALVVSLCNDYEFRHLTKRLRILGVYLEAVVLKCDTLCHCVVTARASALEKNVHLS